MTLISASMLDTSPPEWLVGDNNHDNPKPAPGIIPRVGTGFVWGKRTAGKSLVFGIELGLDIANGVDFLGFPAVHGKVVYCVGEGLYDLGIRKQARLGRQATDDRAAVEAVRAREGDAAAEAFAACLPAYTDDNLYVITDPFVLPTSVNKQPTQELNQVITAIGQLNPDPDDPDYDPETDLDVELIILDSLADFTGISLSNDSSANRITGGMKYMSRKLGCVVLAICHPTKAGNEMLGADRLGNAADFIIAIQKDDTSAPGAAQTASITCEKNKYGDKFEPFGYQIEKNVWEEPARDDDDEIIEGESVTVESATVRRLDADAPPDRAAIKTRPAASLPEVRVPVARGKRTGLKRAPATGLRPGAVPAVVQAGAMPLTTLQDEASRRQEMVRLILIPQCTLCGRPGGMGCDPKMGGSDVLPLGRNLSGPLFVHEDRIMDAALSSPDPTAFFDQAIAAFTPQAVMA